MFCRGGDHPPLVKVLEGSLRETSFKKFPSKKDE
jgi:hypothetical protein